MPLLGVLGCSTRDSNPGSDRIASPLCTTPQSFRIERVAHAGPNGGYPSLALDSQGAPRISYLHGATGELRIATRTRGTWTSEVADVALGPEGFSALAIGPAGKRAVAYHFHEGPVGSVKFSCADATGWKCESVVNDGGDVGHHMAMEIDALGQPWLAFQDVAHGQIRIARRAGTAWDVEAVDTAPGMGAWVSLAFDRIGRPSVSYYRADLGEVRFARKNGASWKIETVSLGTPSSSTHLGFDVAGRPRISFVDNPTQTVRHAVRNGVLWSAEKVDGSAIEEGRTDLVSDASGRVAFGYLDRAAGLRLANRMGDEWVLQTVARNAVAGVAGGVSMRLDNGGRLHMTYVSRGGHVMYAYSTSALPVPSPETVPTPVVPGGKGTPGRELP